MTDDAPDRLPAVGPAATLALEQAADELSDDVEVESREWDGGDERCLSWTGDDGVNRAVIVTLILDPDAVEEHAPPSLVVEHSAWSGPEDGPADATDRGTIADIYDDSATDVARVAVETAVTRVRDVSDGDLEPVPEFL